ncbi:hypothetical protein EPN90_05020 [Patescibacteria group bacterium]|nr:MAG: hypothetical protein EPN90_05020 [Patescibacteria group bacterium]
MFVIIDGIDGSGKGVIVECLAAALREQGRDVFDARAAMRREGRVPGAEDIGGADAVVTTEPAYAWAGLALREELLRNPAYDPLTVAQAFAVDREIHYRRVILPSSAADKLIISERGISGSLAYQVVAGIPEEKILALPGNRLALENPPDLLVLAQLDAETALKRLAARAGKDDGSYYERRPFLEELAVRYRDPAFREIFQSRGTRVIEISTEGTLADTEARARTLLLPLLAQ